MLMPRYAFLTQLKDLSWGFWPVESTVQEGTRLDYHLTAWTNWADYAGLGDLVVRACVEDS